MSSSDSLARKMATLEKLGFRRAHPAPPPGEDLSLPGGLHQITLRRPAMGTLVSLTGIHSSSALIQDAAHVAFQEMERLVRLLNRYDSGSALSVLNSEGRMKAPPPELQTLAREARAHFHASGGAFDPTVQPLVDLLRSEGANGGPSESDLRAALGRVGGDGLEVRPGLIRLGRPGMGLTLDGIAKGYVVDQMAYVLGTRGLDRYLIDAGGDIRCAGVRRDGRPWRVGVQDPGKNGNLPDVVTLTEGAVATSGSYEVFFDPERRHHHLVSAGTGLSPQTSWSVTVLAPTTMTADAMATSVFVMGPERGMDFIESFSQCACLIVDREGRQLRSRRWRSAEDPSTRRQG